MSNLLFTMLLNLFSILWYKIPNGANFSEIRLTYMLLSVGKKIDCVVSAQQIAVKCLLAHSLYFYDKELIYNAFH